jgi:hypothetical protein
LTGELSAAARSAQLQLRVKLGRCRDLRKHVARSLPSRIDAYAGLLFGRLAPGSQRLTRSSPACSESIVENLTISYPNIVGEFVDLHRVIPVGQVHFMLFHRPAPAINKKEFFLVLDETHQNARDATIANKVTTQQKRSY